ADLHKLKQSRLSNLRKSAKSVEHFLSGFENVLDAANRDNDPIGAVVEFVADLVDGFVEQVRFEHDLEIVGILRDEGRFGGGGEITLQKDAAHLAIPEIGPTFEERH